MSVIEELFNEGWEIAEHVGMTEIDPNRRYETRQDKEDFIRTILDYIFWLNQDVEPVEKVLHSKINDRVVDFYRRTSELGE
jgi:hypothetical protein